MSVPADIFHADFHSGLSKIAIFLQNVLVKEPLSAEAEKCRKDCITHVEGMNNVLNSMKINNLKEGHLLNAGLSISSQSLNNTDEFGLSEEGISRSGSLPDMTISHSENSESWTTSGTTVKAFHCSKKYADLDDNINLNDFRELVIYDPIQEEMEDEADDTCNAINQSNESIPCRSSMSSKHKSRKRDSAALFDISLEDLTEPDFAGLLTEKHSGKLWFCVLIDQHLCIFPSQDPDEVAYDVVIMPCCQISLDDRLMRTPVFRLTQSGMQPWVFVASDNDKLKEWMKVLTIAASAGKRDRDQNNSGEKLYSHTQMQPPQMQSIDEEEEEETVVQHQDEQLPVYSSLSVVNGVLAQSSHNSSTSVCEKNEEEQSVGYVNAVTLETSPESEEPPKLPKRPDKIDGEPFGEEVYDTVENVPAGREEFEDDGFATDEFDSGSSDGGDATLSRQTLPVQQKAKKKKHFFKWLKSKAKKDKLFSSSQDGVALAGYAYKSNINSKRWFLIREGQLHCYKAIKDGDAEVVVDLNGCEIKAGEEEKTKLTIRVTRGDKQEFTLIAKSAKDWERWRKALLIESGFIKLAVSPTENTSEPFDQECEEDYITPITPLGMQPQHRPSHEKPDLQNAAGEDGEELYMEVVPMETDGTLQSVSQSSSQQDLGPLPPVPPDLPPRRPQVAVERKDVTDHSKDAGDFELYEEVSTSVSHADKVVRWDGLNNDRTHTRDVMKVYEGEEISESCKDAEDGGAKPTKPPLERKVSFDDKVSYIDRPSPVGNHVNEADNVVENGHELCKDEESDGYLELLRQASKEEMKVELMVQQKIDERRREDGAQQNWRHEVSQEILAKKTLYEQKQESVSDAKGKNDAGLRKREKKIVIEREDGSTSESENGPSAVQRSVRKDSESSDLDKEREDLEKTERAFQKYAKELKEKGAAAVRKKRGSLVALNRLNFEDTGKTARCAANGTRSDSILKEKEELLNKLEILKRRIAVAKDRKIFFTLSTSRSKATADADAEFHESQYELAKTKKRLLEIDNETKNLKVLELKYQKTPEKSRASPGKNPIVRKLSRECKLGTAEVVSPKVDYSNQASNPEKEQAQKGSVLSQIKAFETMKEQK